MNKNLQRADSVESTSQPRTKSYGKQRRVKRSISIRNNQVVTGKCDFNQLNERFNKSLVATSVRKVYSYPSVHGLLERKGLMPAEVKSIKSGSVVISIMDGELRVMDGADCMYKQQVSYKFLSYARSIKADSLIISSSDTKPFGFVSSVFDDNGPVCFWRTLKCNDIVVLVFWGNHEQK